MRLYHTGAVEIREPDILRGRKNADFGQGFYLSVGENLLHPERNIHKSSKFIDLNYLFLETDMAEIGVEKVYGTAANLLGMDLSALKTRIFANFASIFKL